MTDRRASGPALALVLSALTALVLQPALVWACAACGGGKQRPGAMGGGDSCPNRQAAREAVAKHVSGGWAESAYLKSYDKSGSLKKAAKNYIAAAPEVKKAAAGGCPCLLLFVSKEKRRVGNKKTGKEVDSPQAVASMAAVQALKEGDGTDYRCIVAGKYFQRVLIDVTAVTAETDEVFCSEQAPVAVLVDHKGEFEKAFQGRPECNAKKMYGTMRKLAKQAGHKDADKAVNAANEALIECFLAQVRIEFIKTAKKGRRGPALSLVDPREAKAKKRKARALRKEYDALKNGGVLEDALPPAPEGAAG